MIGVVLPLLYGAVGVATGVFVRRRMGDSAPLFYVVLAIALRPGFWLTAGIVVPFSWYEWDATTNGGEGMFARWRRRIFHGGHYR